MPRHLSTQAVKTSKSAALATAIISVNLANTLGNASVHSNRTDRSRTAHVITTAKKTSNTFTKSQQSRRTMTRLLMRTPNKELFVTGQTT